MRVLFSSFLVCFSTLIFCQDIILNPDCENISLEVKSNSQMSIGFMNEEKFFNLAKDTIKKDKIKTLENKELTQIFQKRFPEKITHNCINSEIYLNYKLDKYKECNENLVIKLVDKKFNFYIFKYDGFEISGYFLFDENSAIIYPTNNFPQILENGSVIIDVGNKSGLKNTLAYYKISPHNVEYLELEISSRFQLEEYIITKNQNTTPKLSVSFINYGYKDVSTNPSYRKYEFDKKNYCRKIISIN